MTSTSTKDPSMEKTSILRNSLLQASVIPEKSLSTRGVQSIWPSKTAGLSIAQIALSPHPVSPSAKVKNVISRFPKSGSLQPAKSSTSFTFNVKQIVTFCVMSHENEPSPSIVSGSPSFAH